MAARRILIVARATTEETFAVLCSDLKMPEEVGKALIAAGIENLEEFRFFFTIFHQRREGATLARGGEGQACGSRQG